MKKRSEANGYKVVSIDFVFASSDNPRGLVDPANVSELADSIRTHGIIQPLVITPDGEIIAGERRFRAALLVGLKEVPVIVRDPSDAIEFQEIALIENIQRENLKPITEAKAYRKLIELGLSVEQITVRTGINRATIYSRLDLLNLPESVQVEIENERITLQAAKVLKSITDPERQIEIAAEAVASNLTVNEVKTLANRPRVERSLAEKRSEIVNAVIDTMEKAKGRLEVLSSFRPEVAEMEEANRKLRVIAKQIREIEERCLDRLIAENKTIAV